MLRGTLRVDGFASAHADYSGGDLVTAPLKFKGRRLVLNYSSGAGGSVRIELQSEFGKPLQGFALADAPHLYGDAIDEAYSWKQGSDVSIARRAARENPLRDEGLRPVFVPIRGVALAARNGMEPFPSP